MWKGNPEEEKKPVPHWFHFGLQICVGAFVLYWHWYLPAPNKAVLALASIAALMVLAEMRPIHKAVYFFLILALVFTENRAIDKDRNDFAQAEDYRRKDENRQFQRIADTLSDSLRQSQDQFSETTTRMEGVAKTEKELFAETTGIGSYVYMMPSAPIFVNGRYEATIFPHLVGKHHVSGTIISVNGPYGPQGPLDYGSVFPNELQRPRQVITLRFGDDYKQPISFGIGISGSNGPFFEELQFRKVGATWKRMFAVIKEGKRDEVVCSWMETGLSIDSPSKEEKWLWPAGKETIRTDGNIKPCKRTDSRPRPAP
jgi:hypothetical protein